MLRCWREALTSSFSPGHRDSAPALETKIKLSNSPQSFTPPFEIIFSWTPWKFFPCSVGGNGNTCQDSYKTWNFPNKYYNNFLPKLFVLAFHQINFIFISTAAALLAGQNFTKPRSCYVIIFPKVATFHFQWGESSLSREVHNVVEKLWFIFFLYNNILLLTYLIRKQKGKTKVNTSL